MQKKHDKMQHIQYNNEMAFDSFSFISLIIWGILQNKEQIKSPIVKIIGIVSVGLIEPILSSPLYIIFLCDYIT